MTKTFLILITFIALATATASKAVAADLYYNNNLSIGAKGGVSLSKVNFQSSVPQKMITGAIFGASVRYIEEKHFGLIAELNFEQRGWNEDFEPLEGYSFKRQFTYIQLPLLTHIYFGNEKARVFFNAGPEIGLMIGDKTTSNFDYSHAADIEDFITNYRQTEQFSLPVKRKFDYGISASLGMELSLSSKHALNLEGRFYYGLSDIFSNRKSDPFQGSSSMSIMVTLGYIIRIK